MRAAGELIHPQDADALGAALLDEEAEKTGKSRQELGYRMRFAERFTTADEVANAIGNFGSAALLDLLADRVVERLRPLLERAPATNDPWRLLDVDEAAARLGRSTRWVRERAKRGDLPYVKLDGGALAFELDDLRAFAEARRVGDRPLAGRLHVLGDPASGNGSRRRDQVSDRGVAA